jgi:5-oxoprolinase (ATP-hydrolysing) subunit C
VPVIASFIVSMTACPSGQCRYIKFMSFLVRHPGTYSLLVDLGRPQCRSLGMPVGGAADRAAYLLGNALVGNPANTVALEMTLLGTRLEATDYHGVVVVGADFKTRRNNDLQTLGRTFTVVPGDLLTFQAPQKGLRAYLCVVGGFSSRLILNSRSAREPLKDGQLLECSSSMVPNRFIHFEDDVTTQRGLLRVMRGSHADLVSAEKLVAQEYRVQPSSNRMGLRLRGPESLSTIKAELLSAPVCPGTVQVTHDGHPVVLGMDAQTIGGYPRAAQVIAADLDKLAQLRPGDVVRFQDVDLPAAERAWRERQAWLREWQTRLTVTWTTAKKHPL